MIAPVWNGWKQEWNGELRKTEDAGGPRAFAVGGARVPRVATAIKICSMGAG
jgi:hypothetical protein